MGKPGFKTSEFWLMVAASILGILMASGVIVEGSIWYQIVGGAIAVLSGLGYTWSRTRVKTGE